jgi:hypothetical protein
MQFAIILHCADKGSENYLLFEPKQKAMHHYKPISFILIINVPLLLQRTTNCPGNG